MADPSIAVVIANHDRDDTLVRAVQSAVEQRYDGLIHVYVAYRPRPGVDAVLSMLPPGVTSIAVDDVPGRNSISLKRNAALRAGDEDLVAILDDDDVWHPEKIARQVDALARHGRAVAACTAFEEWRGQWAELADAPARAVPPLDVMSATVVAASSTLIQRAALTGLEFDERGATFAVEDYDLWLRLLPAGEFVLLPQVLTALGPTPASASTRDRRAQHARTLFVLSDRCRDGGLPRRAVRAVARRTLTRLVFARPSSSTDAGSLLDSAVSECLFGSFASPTRRLVRFAWRHDGLLVRLHAARDGWRTQRGQRRR